jgi:hypothetical protein
VIFCGKYAEKRVSFLGDISQNAAILAGVPGSEIARILLRWLYVRILKKMADLYMNPVRRAGW